MAAGITIRGLPETSAALRRLDAAVGKRIVRKALKVALLPMKARVIDLAPIKTGQIRRAVKILAGRSRKGRISVRVVIGSAMFKDDSFYGAFQELGWLLGSRKRGSNRPRIEGKHFMRRAYEEAADDVRDVAEAEILGGIEAEAAKGKG